jgi:hypothetical protein
MSYRSHEVIVNYPIEARLIFMQIAGRIETDTIAGREKA